MARSINSQQTWSEFFGVLGKNVSTRLIEVSRSGCLLESRERVEHGVVGELRLQVGRQTFVDDVRITRCVLLEGSGSCYRIGAEFVQTRRPGNQSIRLAVADILRESAAQGNSGGGKTSRASGRKRERGSKAATRTIVVNSKGEES